MKEKIIRVLQGAATTEDLTAVEAWRRGSEENEREFTELKALWGLLGMAEPDLVGRNQPTVSEVLARVGQPRTTRRNPFVTVGSWRWRRGRRALAVAGLAAVVCLAAVHLWQRNPGAAGAVALGAAEFRTGPTDQVTVELGDGSVVRLGPSSVLRILDQERGRSVWLGGQAFFAVAPRPGQPFVIRTEAGEATVLGTRFELLSRGEDLRLVVVEGKVALTAQGERVEVERDQMSIVAGEEAPEVHTLDDPLELLDWLGRTLIFQATPLEQVASEIERAYGVSIEIEDPELAKRTVSAWFMDQEVAEVVTVVCRVTDIRCAITGDEVTMRR